MNSNEFKSHFYQGSDWIHLNNSGQAPIPDVNRDAVRQWADRFYREAAHCSLEGWKETEVSRAKLAQFVGAHLHEVAFFQTTAAALSQAAFSIPLDPNDEVLTWDQEYPSNFYPWRIACERSGAKLIQVESQNWQTPVSRLLDRVSARTKVIAVSWVQYQTGAVTDLKQLSEALKGKNIWLVADVIQGAGVRPLNFWDSGFDIICGGSHKWLCSGYGSAFMAIKDGRLDQLLPLEFGAMTYGGPDTAKSFSNQARREASKFEPGSKSMIEIIALGATLDLFNAYGINQIFAEACRLAESLAAGLSSLNYEVTCNGSIVNFVPKEKSRLPEVAAKLSAAKVSFAHRGPGIRLSVHAFNTDSEMSKVIELLSR